MVYINFFCYLFLKIWIVHMIFHWKMLEVFTWLRFFYYQYTVKAESSITIRPSVHQISHVHVQFIYIFLPDWPKLPPTLLCSCVKLLWPWPKFLGQRDPFSWHYFFTSPHRHYKCNIRVHFNAKTYICQCVWIMGEKWWSEVSRQACFQTENECRMGWFLYCMQKVRGILVYIEYSNM